MKNILGIFICLFIVSSFQIIKKRPLTKREQHRYDQSITTFKKSKIKKCKLRARERAREIVDSVLIEMDILIEVDSFIPPDKPIKPTKPKFNHQLDTTKAVKIFK